MSKEKSAKKTKTEVVDSEITEQAPGAGSETLEGISKEQYDQLAQELQQSQTQAKDYFEGWQRERADFANYKRRIERDQQVMKHNITADVVKKYLAVLDDLERAIKLMPAEGSGAAWGGGIELIMRKLQNILEVEGIARIPAESEEFDPSRHEAISYEESPEHTGGQIIEVVQQGYLLGDRVIRPALVRVARG